MSIRQLQRPQTGERRQAVVNVEPAEDPIQVGVACPNRSCCGGSLSLRAVWCLEWMPLSGSSHSAASNDRGYQGPIGDLVASQPHWASEIDRARYPVYHAVVGEQGSTPGHEAPGSRKAATERGLSRLRGELGFSSAISREERNQSVPRLPNQASALSEWRNSFYHQGPVGSRSSYLEMTG